MSENPHSLAVREDLLDAIIEKGSERAGTRRFAKQIEQLVKAMRDSEAQGWSGQPPGNPEQGEDRLRVLMQEKLAAFRMREPSMKASDPVWRARASTYRTAGGSFKTTGEDLRAAGLRLTRANWEPHIREAWGGLFGQSTDPSGALINEVLKARRPQGMALQLAYAAWGNPHQSIEDFRRQIERIARQMGPHDHLFG